MNNRNQKNIVRIAIIIISLAALAALAGFLVVQLSHSIGSISQIIESKDPSFFTVVGVFFSASIVFNLSKNFLKRFLQDR
jgi:hypothetical protein